MNCKTIWKTSCATLALLGMVNSVTLAAAAAESTLVPAGATGTAGAAQYRDIAAMTPLTTQQKIALLRQKVKYVFVIFQENRAFDHYFGTYPGANGLFDASGNLLNPPNSGASQPIRNTDGSYSQITPFRMALEITDVQNKTVPLTPEDMISVDHSHAGIDNGLHVEADGVTAQNNGYALDQEGLKFSGPSSDLSTVVSTSTGLPPTANPTLAQKQKGEVVMGHLDCDTVPFLWQYADRFTMFDNFRQTIIGPSTPNAIAMIAGQVGETQWALHPAQGANGTVPVVGDTAPLAGSNKDTSAVKPSWGPDENPNSTNGNLTFATLPLSFMGGKIGQIITQDQNPAADLLDVQHDIMTVASKDANVNWGWYQQGFDAEPFDNSGFVGGGSASSSCQNAPGPGVISGCNWPTHSSYIVHHNGPQYFGYLGSNKTELTFMHGLQDFYTDVAAQKLPAQGGVFYVRGGYGNNDGLVPQVPNPLEQALFVGNDDHASYSDSMVSEAMVADTVNAIAKSPYWSQSAIIITYDETDGLWDHAPVSIRSYDQNHQPLSGGPRIPAIVISPFSVAHAISREYSEHSSVIKFIDELFGLVPLADLPDEERARQLGQSELGQPNLGPADDKVPMGDLTEAFDNDRLLGSAPPLPASYAMIDSARILKMPHDNRQGCSVLGITPTDFPNGLANPPSDPAPADFNPRPSTAPGIPAQGTGTAANNLVYPWQP